MGRSRNGLSDILTEVARTAATLCEAKDCLIFLVEGEQLRVAAQHGALRYTGTPPINRQSVMGRAILDRQTLHVRDLKMVRKQFPASPAVQHASGIRTVVATPLLLDGAAVGGIAIRRTVVRPFTPKQISLLKTFADQAAVAIENARLADELAVRNRELTEALERETATSEILRVISSSPTELQPVLDAVAESATRVCAAYDAVIRRLDDDGLRHAAHYGPIPSSHADFPVTRSRVAGRALLDRQPVQVADALAESEEFPETSRNARERGFRTILSVPLLREGVAIGTLDLRRTEVRPFTEPQIALLQTFADQAVIAIENVRLFTELQIRNRELMVALDQQTATSEILRVISSSPTDVQPVFSAIADSSARLCEAFDAMVLRVEGDVLRLVAHHGPMPAGDVPLHRGTLGGRTVIERRLFHIPDLQTEAAEFPEGSAIARQRGHRTTLSLPLLREGIAIGNIQVRRSEVRPFSDQQIALLRTFADQAVIAIENVRLFTELQARNRELTEALEQQTATSEVLRVIAQSPTDLQPVLDAVVASAVKLAGATRGHIRRYDGEFLPVVAHHNLTGEMLTDLQHIAVRPTRDSAVGRAFLERQPIHIPDVLQDPHYRGPAIQIRTTGRTVLAVPLLLKGNPIGTISIFRPVAQPFTSQQIELLQTSADQAVIAIENVRLFKEVQARNAELTEALEQQTATAEILAVIS
ncbi:MAG: GAF domain-containing protein, partial [Candidatus Rokuibacteriota bacterium]